MYMESQVSICPNCGHKNNYSAKFCENCSQKTQLRINSVWRMLFDFLANLIDYDSKLFSSIRGLFFPGFLTNEYLAKKRVRYLTPIRLFIFLMVALFFSMSLMNIDHFNLRTGANSDIVSLSVNNAKSKESDNNFDNSFYTVLERSYQALRFETLLKRLEKELNNLQLKYKETADELKSSEDNLENQQKIIINDKNLLKNKKALNALSTMKKNIDIKEGEPVNIKLFNDSYKISLFDFSRLSAEQLIEKYQVTNWLDKILFKQMYKFNHEASAFARFVFQNLTWVIFLEVLLLSLFFKLFYLRSKKKYVEHFILQLHVHAWLFFIAIIFILIPFKINYWVNILVAITISIYLFLSMKYVYKQSYIKTFIKFILLSFIDLIIFNMAFVVVLLISTFVF